MSKHLDELTERLEKVEAQQKRLLPRMMLLLALPCLLGGFFGGAGLVVAGAVYLLIWGVGDEMRRLLVVGLRRHFSGRYRRSRSEPSSTSTEPPWRELAPGIRIETESD